VKGREEDEHFVGFVGGDQPDVFGGGETTGEFGAGQSHYTGEEEEAEICIA
jgi:hypothetical protein